MPVTSVLDDVTEFEIVNKYRNNRRVTIEQLSLEYHVCQTTIKKILKFYIGDLKDLKKIPEADYPSILKRYYSGERCVDLAEEYEVSKGTMYNTLVKAGWTPVVESTSDDVILLKVQQFREYKMPFPEIAVRIGRTTNELKRIVARGRLDGWDIK